ncbi:MAG: hypothetical protein RL220_1941 [Bacteroidota bacterium]
MKKVIYIFSAATLILASCSNDTKTGEKTVPQADTTAKPLTKEDWEQRAKERPELTEVNNTTSAYKYMLTTEDYKAFADMVALSSYAKKLHNENFVVLCPSSKIIKTLDPALVAEIKKPANKDLLDKYVAGHIIASQFSVQKPTELKMLKTIDGRSYNYSSDSKKVGDVQLVEYETQCKFGSVIEANGTFDFPKEDLIRRMRTGK